VFRGEKMLGYVGFMRGGGSMKYEVDEVGVVRGGVEEWK
jgi:hypothetical protein